MKRFLYAIFCLNMIVQASDNDRLKYGFNTGDLTASMVEPQDDAHDDSIEIVARLDHLNDSSLNVSLLDQNQDRSEKDLLLRAARTFDIDYFKVTYKTLREKQQDYSREVYDAAVRGFIEKSQDADQTVKSDLFEKLRTIFKFLEEPYGERPSADLLFVPGVLKDVELVDFLRLYGVFSSADFERVDEQGDTPLLIACTYGSTYCVDYLLCHKVNILAKNKRGENAFIKAEQQNNPRILILLNSYFSILYPSQSTQTDLHGIDLDKIDRERTQRELECKRQVEQKDEALEDMSDLLFENEKALQHKNQELQAAVASMNELRKTLAERQNIMVQMREVTTHLEREKAAFEERGKSLQQIMEQVVVRENQVQQAAEAGRVREEALHNEVTVLNQRILTLEQQQRLLEQQNQLLVEVPMAATNTQEVQADQVPFFTPLVKQGLLSGALFGTGWYCKNQNLLYSGAGLAATAVANVAQKTGLLSQGFAKKAGIGLSTGCFAVVMGDLLYKAINSPTFFERASLGSLSAYLGASIGSGLYLAKKSYDYGNNR